MWPSNRVRHKLLRFVFISCFLSIVGCADESRQLDGNSLSFQLAGSEPSSSANPDFGVATTTIPESASTLPQLPANDPFDLLEKQFTEIEKSRDKCTQKPRECEVETFVLPNSPYERRFSDRMRKFAKYNIYSRPGRGSRSITIEGIDRDRVTNSALIRGCVADSIVLFMDGAIYDNNVISSLSIWRLQWRNDRWYLADVTVERRFFDSDKCEWSNDN